MNSWLFSSLLLKLDLCVFVCVFVFPVCIKVIGEWKTIENVVYPLICGVIEKVNNLNITWRKHIGYADSEYHIVNKM